MQSKTPKEKTERKPIPFDDALRAMLNPPPVSKQVKAKEKRRNKKPA